MAVSSEPAHTIARREPRLEYRHRLSTRIWHWVNAVTLIIMVMSGLMIFSAHPRLYWGRDGHWGMPAWLEINASEEMGYVEIAGAMIETTGFLGGVKTSNGDVRRQVFPAWATLPSNYNLVRAREWHITFAWLFVASFLFYAISNFVNGHFFRDHLPRLNQCGPGNLWRCFRNHLRLSFHPEERGELYNIFQKISYFLLIYVTLPLVILTGLCMSPGMNAALPWLTDIFGGRQSARSIHFILAVMFILFIVVHLALVLLARPINQMRGMITGWARPWEREE